MESTELWQRVTLGMLDTIKATKQDYPLRVERRIALEGELLSFVWEDPKAWHHDYLAKFKVEGFDIRNFMVKDALKRMGFFYFAPRKRLIDLMTSSFEDLKNLVDEPEGGDVVEQTLKDINYFLVGTRETSDKRILGGVRRKAFLIGICLYLKEIAPQIESVPELMNEVKQLSFKDTKVVILKLFREFARCFGLAARPQNWGTTLISERDVAHLKLPDQHDTLSDDLEWQVAMLQIENEDFEERKLSVPEATAKNFIAQLNSTLSGKILDVLDTTALYLRNGENQSEIENFDPKVKELISLVKELREFFTSLGLQKSREVGEPLELQLDQVTEFEYFGSPFATEDETKRVRVTAPGWEYADLGIVLRPEVREVKSDIS